MKLLPDRVKKPKKPKVPKEGTLGQRLADRTAAVIGSWPFIITQAIILAAWMAINLWAAFKFDPYPFIFLNLVLSFQAAFAGPVIMMAANRNEQTDRKRSIDNLAITKQDHKKLMDMFDHIDGHFHRLNTRLDELDGYVKKNSDKV